MGELSAKYRQINLEKVEIENHQKKIEELIANEEKRAIKEFDGPNKLVLNNYEQIDVLRQRTQLKRAQIKAKEAELARRREAKKRLLDGIQSSGQGGAQEEQIDSGSGAKKASK